MSICSSDIISLSTTYDCVKLCDQVLPMPIAEYEYDAENFKLTPNVSLSSGVVEYKWVIENNGYELYSSGFGIESDALPLIGNASTFDEFLFGADFIDLKNMLDGIAPYYEKMELEFVLTIRDGSGKTSEPSRVLRLIL